MSVPTESKSSLSIQAFLWTSICFTLATLSMKTIMGLSAPPCWCLLILMFSTCLKEYMIISEWGRKPSYMRMKGFLNTFLHWKTLDWGQCYALTTIIIILIKKTFRYTKDRIWRWLLKVALVDKILLGLLEDKKQHTK